MGFTELAGIKLPKALFEAAKSGELVVFAGAGVSMQGKTPLPDFGSLVEGVSQKVDAERKLDPFDKKNDSCEEYLGELETLYGEAVRTECAQMLSAGTCAEVHRNIISLFESGPIRVVTTNFDLRFEQAADELGVQVRVFSGPALPVGDSFEGLVHLHGSLEYPGEMVLSDSDFGKAYVSDGWASRFLVRMFSRFTVLFIGYSFSDTLVQYLARSISADVKGRVFALERESDKFEAWSKRGIIPIGFESYGQLPDLFHEWHRRDAISVYECSKTIEHVAAITVEASSEEKEELAELLRDSSPEEQTAYAEVYARASQDFSAVKLLVGLGFDEFLFQEELSSRDSVLSAWIAKVYAMTDYLQLMLLATEKGKNLSRNLCSRVLFELCHNDPDDACLSAWASYVEPSMVNDGGSAPYYFYRLIESCDDSRIAFSWIQKLFAVRPACQRDFFDREPRGLTPVFVFDGESFSRQLTESIAHHTESLGWDLFWFLVNQLEEARDIETGHGTDTNAFDSWSFGRSAIEEHEQDEYSRGLISVLIAVLRETGCSMMPGCGFGIDVVERCVSSHAHLVKRMGLYLLPLADVPADRVLDFLIGHGCLRDSYLIHEVFGLLSSSYPCAGPEAKAALIEEVRETYPDITDGNDAYGRFNVLKWLDKYDGEDESISAELESIHELFPDYQVSEHPDLNHYMSSGWGREDDRFEVSEDEFSPERLRELCSMAEQSRSMLTKWDIVSAPMRQYPRKCLDVTKRLLSSPEDDYREMAKIALSSICWENIEEASLREASEVIMAGLQCEDAYPSSVRAMKNFIESLKESVLEREALWRPALDLAFGNAGWLSTEDYMVGDPTQCDWLTISINHASGALIGSVSKIVSVIAEKDDVAAREFGRQYIGKLVSLLEAHGECSRCLAASFLAEINIWVFVDSDLTESTLSRIFAPTSLLLVPAWQGLSYVSRLSENSWNALKERLAQFPNATSLRDESLNHLGSLFVWGAIVYGSNDERKGAVAISSAASSKVCSAVSFRLLDWVGQLKDDARIVEWESWLDESIRAMFASDENFKAAGHYLVRWLEKCGCLAPEVGRLLIDWRKRKCDGIVFDQDSLIELIANGASENTDKALLLVFFLSAAPTYHSFAEFEEVAKGLDPKAINKSALSELRDAFVLRFASVPSCLE